MRKVLLLLMFLSTAGQAQQPFKEAYAGEYQQALEYLATNLEQFKQVLGKQQEDSRVLIAVVFPEMVRYSIIQDKVETISLKVFYTNLGKDYSNFSIGRLQMKPSFVEKLETAARKIKHCRALSVFTGTKAEDRRHQRVSRLEQIDWQLHYLACFAKVVRRRFGRQYRRLSVEQKIRFLAACYNIGFDKSYSFIKKWERKRYFPHGRWTLKSFQHRYSDVAWQFYNKDWQTLPH